MGDLKSGYYYLDSKGQRVKNTWIGDYYLMDDGLMAKDKWIGEGKDKIYVGIDGERVMDYQEAVNIVKDILGTQDKYSNYTNNNYKGLWSLDYYVDNFGDDTDEKYVAGFFDGSFSNNVFKNQNCKYKLLIGKDYVDVMMFEYGTKKFENQIVTLDVNIKNQYGQVLDCEGYFDMDRMRLDSKGCDFLFEALKSPGNIKILINSSDVNINRYLVEIESDNFMIIYNQII